MNRAALVASVAVIGACDAGIRESPTTTNTTPISNKAATPDRSSMRWRISETGLGPITADTQATEGALRDLLPGLTVKTVNLGGGSGIVFEVFDRDEKVFYVVPDDGEGDADRDHKAYALTIFSMFATSPKIFVEGFTWRVGEPLATGAELTNCECWGVNEVTACYKPGSHLRVIFESDCSVAQEAGGKAMVGKPIGRVMWKRVP